MKLTGVAMQRLITFAVLGLLIGGLVGSGQVWAQLGNPTARPAGGANVPAGAVGAGTAGNPTALPAGGANVSATAGGAGARTAGRALPGVGMSSAGTAGTGMRAIPITAFGTSGFGAGVRPPPTARTDSGVIFGQQGFGRGPDFGGGTTRMMFERNPGMLDRFASPGNLSVQDALFLEGFRTTSGVPITPVVPIVPLVPQGNFATTTAIDPSAPQDPRAPTSEVVPILVMPGDARRARVEDRRTITPREPPLQRMGEGGVATATAYPVRNLTSPGDAEVITTPRSATPTVRSQVVEVPATPQARSTAYVRWQGYWWHHNPQTGWHYWDGARWVHFAGLEN